MLYVGVSPRSLSPGTRLPAFYYSTTFPAFFDGGREVYRDCRAASPLNLGEKDKGFSFLPLTLSHPLNKMGLKLY